MAHKKDVFSRLTLIEQALETYSPQVTTQTCKTNDFANAKKTT